MINAIKKHPLFERYREEELKDIEYEYDNGESWHFGDKDGDQEADLDNWQDWLSKHQEATVEMTQDIA